jgi:hypothetical protein
MLLKCKLVNLKERDIKEGLGVDGRRVDHKEIRDIGLIRLKIGIIGDPL